MGGRINKRGEWQELFVLAESEMVEMGVQPGPAVRVTFARFGNEVRFSHTPGVIDDKKEFRHVQHLHDRNILGYVGLFQETLIAVAAAKQIGPEAIMMHPMLLKEALSKARRDIATMDQKSQPKKSNPKTNPKSDSLKPTLGASIGDILKAKQS